LECPKAPLIHQQVVFPISNGRVRLIFLEVIVLAIYLEGWALVAPIIAFRFLLDSHPLLLKAIGASKSRPLPFQAHLKLVQKLVLLGVVVYVLSFEYLAKKGINHL